MLCRNEWSARRGPIHHQEPLHDRHDRAGNRPTRTSPVQQLLLLEEHANKATKDRQEKVPVCNQKKTVVGKRVKTQPSQRKNCLGSNKAPAVSNNKKAKK